MGSGVLFLLVGVACKGKATDTSSDEVTDTGECRDYWIHYDGPDEPQVGDKWHLTLYCDDVKDGWMLLRIYPGDLASFDDDVATFVKAGEGEFMMQTGVYRTYLPVTIREAD